MAVKEPTGDLKKACWKGYTAVGMKNKNGRKVPNCVPVKEESNEPKDREWGTTKLTKRYKKDTPGQCDCTQKEEVEQMDELKQSTLQSYKDKVSVDSMKHKMDPTKRKPEKASRSVAGYARADAKMAKEEVDQMDEAHKLGDRVKIIRGSGKGKEGTIGEIRHGLYKGAPKWYTVYHGDHGAIQVGKEDIRAMKEDEKQKDRDHVLSSKRKTKLDEQYLTPAQRRERAMSSSGGEFGPTRSTEYGRDYDFGHEAPVRGHVPSEPKDHGLTVHNHEGKEIGTVQKNHPEPMTVAMNIAMKHSHATGENTEVRRFGKKVQSFKGKKVNESNYLERPIRIKQELEQIDEENRFKNRADAAAAAREQAENNNPSIIVPHPNGGYMLKPVDRGAHSIRQNNENKNSTRNIIREVITKKTSKVAGNGNTNKTGTLRSKVIINPTALADFNKRGGI